MFFNSNSTRPRIHESTADCYKPEASSFAAVKVTRDQIRNIDRQNRVAGDFRLTDAVLGELEQVLVNELELSDQARLALVRLFGKSLKVIPGKNSPIWPTEWLRDSFLQATNVESSYRSLLASDPINHVRQVTNRAETFASIPLSNKPVMIRCLSHYIEGGDILPIAERLFVGMNSIMRSRYVESVQAKKTVDYRDTRQRFIDRLTKWFGREVVVLDGMDLPPLFHLDLYVSAVLQANGRPKFFIGDVQSFIDDIAGMSPQTMREEQAFYDWFKAEEDRLASKASLYHFNYEDHLREVRYGSFKEQYSRVQQRLDRVKELLISDFEVESVPLPYIARDLPYSEPKQPSLPDDVRGKVDLCYDEEALVFSPLNTIVSCGLHDGTLRQKVYGAKYGFRRVDNTFAQKLRANGALLRQEGGFSAHAYNGGGLHCLTSDWRKDFIASGTLWDKLGQLI